MIKTQKYEIQKATVVSIGAEIEEQDADAVDFTDIVEDFIVNLEFISGNMETISNIAEKSFRQLHKGRKIHKFQVNHMGHLDLYHLVIVKND